MKSERHKQAHGAAAVPGTGSEGNTYAGTESELRSGSQDSGTRAVNQAPIPLSAQAWVISELFKRGERVVWVLDGPPGMEVAHNDLRALGASREAVAVFPAWEGWPEEVSEEIRGQRYRTLFRLLKGERLIVVTCIQALQQKVPPPDLLAGAEMRLRVGQEVDPEKLIRELEQQGYEPAVEVEARGQVARRGGIVDVWPAESELPIRVEFFGSVVDSLRRFDPASQRSKERLEQVNWLRPIGWREIRKKGVDLGRYLCSGTVVLISDEEQVEAAAEIFEEAAAEAGAMEYVLPEELLEDSFRLNGVRRIAVGSAGGSSESAAAMFSGLEPAPRVPCPPRGFLEPDVAARVRRDMLRGVLARTKPGGKLLLFFDTEGSRKRFEESYGDWLEEVRRSGSRVELREGMLSGGFIHPAERLVVLAESDIYGQAPDRVLRAPRLPTVARFRGLESWSEIQPGDLVVHVDHGIGKYLGVYQITVHGRPQEVLAVEYAGGSRLFVPVSQAHLLSRYIGLGRRLPELHRLHSPRWQRQKAAAQRSVADLAAQMLEVQAIRETHHGHAFGPDTVWQREFEAAFPFSETEDQLRAIEEVKRDMEQPRPMDRLICGDVGYGKTEVAMRAAFKAVMDGKQVAVLVPTTVLAQQHYDTFRERMAAFPITIEMLSRFRTESEQRRIVQGLADGRIDIVIGTHRLLQPDVQFRDLGLVVIDEEQRFGVEHKERFKQMRALVDVLTMSATPIPRTLYLSLTGVRDMSVIETPPQERLPIETVVAEYDESLVRNAILRELGREGQVYYLYNRVATIEQKARRLGELVPEARIAIAHGQMDERELSEVMHRFVQRQIDVLVCTTIIESGVDIPNVNTILIDRADRFGIADLYQLRGRVGRYRHQAYAYLLLPRHGRLFATARRRIRTIRRHSSLGAGFKLALRDLEMRGAGNLLGREQSGHIAAVGFELYCQLLRRAVARLKGEELPPLVTVQMLLDFVDLAPQAGDRAAAIPHEYVEDETLRLQLYRRLAAVASHGELETLREEWRDRFGDFSRPVENLLLLAELRLVAAERGIEKLQVKGKRVYLWRSGELVKQGSRFPCLTAEGTAEKLQQLIELIRSI